MKLHEILAIIPDTHNVAKNMMDEAVATFTKKGPHFIGITKKTKFFDDARAAENLSESKEMVTTVEEKLDHVMQSLGRNWDTLLKQDESNQRAVSDVEVDGLIIGKDVPAQFLLTMENRIVQLRAVLAAMPTLDAAYAWIKDENDPPGVYTGPPQTTYKSEKIVSPVILYEATKEHPAQVREVSRDVNVAKIETVTKSGMMSIVNKASMLERLDKLIHAIKKARQRANCVEVNKDLSIADAMFKWIMTGA